MNSSVVIFKNRLDCEKINHMRKEKYDGRRVDPHNSAPYDLIIVMLRVAFYGNLSRIARFSCQPVSHIDTPYQHKRWVLSNNLVSYTMHRNISSSLRHKDLINVTIYGLGFMQIC